ncbi:MAG: hypothetical protein ACRYG4_19755 [Janthinobacterium lividum]
MSRLFFVLGALALVSTTPGNAREARHHALPPVPQSADIAALNREQLAKMSSGSGATSADSAAGDTAPAVKKAARSKR